MVERDGLEELTKLIAYGLPLAGLLSPLFTLIAWNYDIILADVLHALHTGYWMLDSVIVLILLYFILSGFVQFIGYGITTTYYPTAMRNWLECIRYVQLLGVDYNIGSYPPYCS